MPSPALRHVQPMVKRHCADLDVPYTETTLLDSYRIALGHMHEIGTDAREADALGCSPVAMLRTSNG